MNVTGIKRILSELADPLNKCGGATLLYHVMIRDASEKSLHSKAGKALSFLLKDSTFSSCDDFPQGKSSFPNICSGSTVEAIVPTFMDSSDVLGKFLGLMLCTIDIPSDVNELESIAHFFVEYFLLVIDHVNVPVC
ncbi:hypothetical protein F2Q70_00020639 [Brassica cretica]|uniref:Uncharacterized protein n=1 Tax=Brassica cretica TaxID=69181 RepID=A0A8S9GRE0_BRACR|nr:hypothetical protein F2Q70_00020639 [Brassica cretica]